MQLTPIALLATVFSSPIFALKNSDASLFSSSSAPKLMLANKFSDIVDLNKYLVSEKFDGVRAYWNGEQLITRNGNFINAPEWFIERFPNYPLDGELWLDRGKYDRVSGIIRKTEPKDEEWKQIKYMVFDLPYNPKTFLQRNQDLKSLVEALNIEHLQIVKQFEVDSRQMLDEKLNMLLKAGAEGLMLRLKTSVYQGKRSNDLLKYKPHHDAEATVVAHIPGKGQFSGLLGALLVKTRDGRQFKIGTGFSRKERLSPPALGSTITFRYRGLTSTGLPRFASFLRIRDET